MLLLIIPGVIHSYRLRMVPYLLIENPEITFSELKEKSDLYTYERKSEIFVLDISFIGWELLVSCIPLILSINIGMIPLAAYRNLTDTELYFDLKKKIKNELD